MTEVLAVRGTGKTIEGQLEDAQEYVSFYLNDEIYAIDAMGVQEIIAFTNITKVPHLPEFMKGVINLRGTIIPVVDLKLKFGMTTDGYRKNTCIIVAEFSGGVMGLIVDAVSDVMHMAKEMISAPPSFGAKIHTEFIKGMGKVGDNLVIVLDIDKALTQEEASILSDVTSEAINAQ